MTASAIPTTQIDAAAATVKAQLSPWIKYIGYDLDEDWTGQPAVFFRVLLSDEAVSRDNLRRLAPQILHRLADNLDIPTYGVFPHVRFRSESEQARMNDPGWA